MLWVQVIVEVQQALSLQLSAMLASPNLQLLPDTSPELMYHTESSRSLHMVVSSLYE
jgi:hypothetical protein